MYNKLYNLAHKTTSLNIYVNIKCVSIQVTIPVVELILKKPLICEYCFIKCSTGISTLSTWSQCVPNIMNACVLVLNYCSDIRDIII